MLHLHVICLSKHTGPSGCWPQGVLGPFWLFLVHFWPLFLAPKTGEFQFSACLAIFRCCWSQVPKPLPKLMSRKEWHQEAILSKMFFIEGLVPEFRPQRAPTSQMTCIWHHIMAKMAVSGPKFVYIDTDNFALRSTKTGVSWA